MDCRSTGGTKTPKMRFLPNNSRLQQSWQLRLATTVAYGNAHGSAFSYLAATTRASTRARKPRRLTVRGRPGRSLRKFLVRLLLPGYCGSTGPGFSAQILARRAKRRHKLSTLAFDAMLRTPDQLDRLSRRSDGLGQSVVPPAKKHRGVCQQ